MAVADTDTTDTAVMRVATLAERKAREAARRKSAANRAVDEMRLYAADHGGRFVVFGSWLRDAFRYDSDLDVLIDFPAETATAAWLFLEDLGARLDLPIDLHDAATSKQAFVERVRATGRVIG